MVSRYRFLMSHQFTNMEDFMARIDLPLFVLLSVGCGGFCWLSANIHSQSSHNLGQCSSAANFWLLALLIPLHIEVQVIMPKQFSFSYSNNHLIVLIALPAFEGGSCEESAV